MLLRILASILLLISVLFWPFWVSLILAFAGIVYFRLFWEAVILLFLSDLLFGAKEERYFGIIFLSLGIGVALLLLVEFFKKKLKFYNEK